MTVKICLVLLEYYKDESRLCTIWVNFNKNIMFDEQ